MEWAEPVIASDFQDWGLFYENASNELVTAQFGANQGIAQEFMSTTLNLISNLQSLNTYTIPAISYTKATVPSISNISASAPVAPSGSINLPSAPQMQGSIDAVSLNMPAVPVDNTGAVPSTSFLYSEDPYVSSLLTRLRTRIEDVVTNGGEALSDAVQQSILDNALTADEVQHDLKYNEAQNFYASRGLSAPPGALVARLNMLNRERARTQQRITSELTNKMAELAHNHGQFMTDLGVKLEGLTIDQKDKIQNRALEYAKQVALIPVEIYKIRMQAFTNAVEAYKSQVSAEATKVDAVTKKNLSIVEVYKGQVQAYDALARAETAVYETAAKIYTAEVAGFEAMVKAESANMELYIERFKAEVQQAGLDLQMSSKAAELYTQKITAYAQRDAVAIGDATKASAQIAAAALSATNVSAGIGFTQSETTTDQRQMSKDDRSSNSGIYQETKSVQASA